MAPWWELLPPCRITPCVGELMPSFASAQGRKNIDRSDLQACGSLQPSCLPPVSSFRL